jgi:hypothetical protein
MIWYSLTLVLALSSIAVTAQAVPVLKATRVERPPTLDGKLDDACWQAAAPYATFLINNTTQPAQYATAASVVYDDVAIYIGVRCAEPRPADIQIEPLPRDNPNVFRTDCVEVMLDPLATQNDYYHFGVNAAGVLADRSCTQGGFIGDMSWDSTARSAAFIGPDFWSCELAIPYSCLGLTPRVGSTWRINICREKKLPAENSSLAVEGAFNIASRFAELQGMEAQFERYFLGLGELVLAKQLRGGKLQLIMQVPVRNDTGHGGPRLLDGWLTSDSGKVISASSLIEPPVGQEKPYALGPFVVEQQGDYTCYVRVADPVTKQALAYRKQTLPLYYVPLAIHLREPWYRHAIFATQKLANVTMDVEASLEAEALVGLKLGVEVRPARGQQVLVSSSTSRVQRQNRVIFPVNKLPEGELEIVAVLQDAAGTVVAETRHPLRKLKHHPGEVWMGKDLQWYVEGKPFFLNGAWNYPQNFLPEYNAFTGELGEARLLDCTLMNDAVYRMKTMREPHLSAADIEIVRAQVLKVRDNPRFFGYFISDEPEVSGTHPGALQDMYDTIVALDPWHPVIISNDSMEGLRVYARCADINGLHPYPVMLRDKQVNDLLPVATFIEETVKFFAPLPHKQTVAYLHQGFNYGDYGAVNNRIPNYVEYRNQNLLALICGARGTIQFNRMVEHYPELYLGMPHLTRELRFLESILVQASPSPAASAAAEKVKLLTKIHRGQLYLLASNAEMSAREVKLTLPGAGKLGRRLNVVSEGRSVALQGDTFSDRFEPWEVHVYTTAPAPNLPTVKQIVAEIAAANAARRKPGNLAFQEFEGDGVVVSASSSQAAKYRRPDTGLWHVVDGVIDTIDHYRCLTWQDDTPGEGPDWLEIKLPKPAQMGRVVVYPFEKSLKDYTVEVSVGGQWREVAKVSAQSGDRIEHTFEPVTSDRLRLVVTGTNGPQAMVTEVEVYER